MARQNVGNPKFYIDLLSYFKASGLMTSAYGGLGSSDTIDISKLIGLAPEDYLVQEATGLGGDNFWFNKFYLEQMYRVSDTTKQFVAILNHNFLDAKIDRCKVRFVKNGVTTETIEVPLEVCNYPESSTPFEYNGFSIADFTRYNDIFDQIEVLLHKDTSDEVTTADILMGSIAWGQVFQMPHSPDLKLTMTREYDGTKSITSKGGSTLTQVNYSSPPLWGAFPPWYLTENNMIDHNITNDYKEKRASKRGRKTWNLKFSYINHKNLFPLNESISRFNPTDSSSSEGYDSDDFWSTGHFKNDDYGDNSFMNIVMGKTMGGALPFIFQPDGNNNSPDQFAKCVIDQKSFQFKAISHQVYNVSLKIREVW